MSNIPYDYIVFTDASYKKVSGIGYCGFGVAILNTETMNYVDFGSEIGNRTIAYGELWAIYRGIEKTLQFIGKKKESKILVVTDSKLSVMGFSYYIPKKWDLSNWHDWKTVNRKPVKNQAVYRKTLETLSKYPKVAVRIAHMHSHTSKKASGKIKDDLRYHGINATDETVELFRNLNARVDEIAGSVVDQQIKNTERFGEIPILVRTEFMEDTEND